MEMNGGSVASYLVRAPCVPLLMLMLIGPEVNGLLDFRGRRGITSVGQWNLRPVIFGVEKHLADQSLNVPRSFCDPSRHLQESSGPPGPKPQKSLKKSQKGSFWGSR